MAVDREDFEMLDERYVQISDCNEKQRKTDKKFANDDKRLYMMEERAKRWDKMMTIITTAVVGQFVALIFGMVGFFLRG